MGRYSDMYTVGEEYAERLGLNGDEVEDFAKGYATADNLDAPRALGVDSAAILADLGCILDYARESSGISRSHEQPAFVLGACHQAYEAARTRQAAEHLTTVGAQT